MSYRFSRRLYQLLLLTYPARFRTRYSKDMESDFIDLLKDSSHRGFLQGRLICWYRVILDLARSVPREHLRSRGERRRIPHIKRTSQPVGELMSDVHYALRGLRKDWGFAAGSRHHPRPRNRR
jgi:hypothetical protein